MISIFTKPVSDVTGEDVQQLVAEQVPEGSTVEFKESLPRKKGAPDVWTTKEQVSGHSRDEILAEVVAFANAHGGQLVIGIQESEDHPKRAAGLSPLPNCAELAERLRLQARDCIEPQMPLVTCRGVPLDDEGNGVVLVRVERSYLAPHRLIPTKECYFRRADRTERMTMREIQDLTLQTDRGSDRLEAVFARHRHEFIEWVGTSPGEERAGFRVTIAPVWPLRIERIDRDSDAFPRMRDFDLSIGRHILELQIPGSFAYERPIVRGRYRDNPHDHFLAAQFMRTDGTGEIRVNARIDKRWLYPDWVIGGVANAIRMAAAFRTAAGPPTAEYALEWALFSSTDSVSLGPLWRPTSPDPDLMTIAAGTLLPQLSVGARAEWDNLLQQTTEDLLAAAGEEAPPGPYSADW